MNCPGNHAALADDGAGRHRRIADWRGLEDVSGLLTEQDFYSPRHAVMFRAIAAMSAIGLPIDPLHMLDWLISNQLDSLAGGEEYLGDLIKTHRPPLTTCAATPPASVTCRYAADWR